MDYIEKSLAPNERIVVRGRWPKIYWVGAWAALIVLGIAIVGIVVFIRAWVIMSSTRFAVTDQRVVLKRGWLNVDTAELAVESIESVHLSQSLWGRIFGYGNVVVTGTGDARIVFPPMAHPVEFRRAIEAGRSAGKEVHVAAEDIAALRETDAPAPKEGPEAGSGKRPPRRNRGRSFIGVRS